MTYPELGKSVNNITVTENVLTKEEHKLLLEYVESIDSWRSQPWGVKSFSPKDMPKQIIDILDRVFMIAYQKCIDHYSVNLYPFQNERVPLIKFDEGYKMNEHADTAGDFAVIYYINDDYEGGEINFIDHGIIIKPKVNSFITFPSNDDYWHEVLKNTGKERYSATQWFKFDGSSLERPALGLIR